MQSIERKPTFTPALINTDIELGLSNASSSTSRAELIPARLQPTRLAVPPALAGIPRRPPRAPRVRETSCTFAQFCFRASATGSLIMLGTGGLMLGYGIKKAIEFQPTNVNDPGDNAFTHAGGLLTFGGMIVFGSAVPLGISAVTYSMMRRSRREEMQRAESFERQHNATEQANAT